MSRITYDFPSSGGKGRDGEGKDLRRLSAVSVAKVANGRLTLLPRRAMLGLSKHTS